MAKRKKSESLGFLGPTRDLVIGGSVLGIGATVVAKVGGSTAASSGAGLSAAASFLPVFGVTIGGGLALRQLRRLQGQTTRRKRRR